VWDRAVFDIMNRLLGFFTAFVLGIWAQRILTGPEPGIPRDALILFVLAAVVFTWSARPPRPLRPPGAIIGRPWPRLGLLLTLAGLAVGVVALILLWQNLQSLAGLLLWPVAVVLFVGGAFVEQKKAEEQRSGVESRIAEDGSADDDALVRLADHQSPVADRRSRLAPHASQLFAHWDLLLLALILVVAWWARFHQLDIYPNGCQSDECNNGLDALEWLSGAVYTPYAETNEGQATLFTYLIALSFQVFGAGVAQMRFVSALVGVLTVAAFYFLGRDLYGRKAALVATALLAADRWHITFSRIVYELIMQPLFMILLVFFLLRSLRDGRRRHWALAGVMLAAGMNTYTAFRVVPFFIAAFLLFWLVRSLAIGWRQRRADPATRQPFADLRQDLAGMALLAGGAFTAVLPLGVYTIKNWNVFISRIQHISVMRDVERVGSNQPIVDNLRKTLYMFNWQGDNAALNNLPGAPMLGAVVAVLFVLGLGYSVWHLLRAQPVPVLYVMWFAAVASLAVLSVAHEAPTARRTIGLVPLIYLLVALVADQLFTVWQRALGGLGQRALNVAVTVGVALVAIASLRTYFEVQAPHPDVWGAYSPNESAVGEFLTTLPPDAVVLITPQFEHHSAIKLTARDHPHQALNPVQDLPYRQPASGDLVYVLEPVDQPLFSLLEQVYPAGYGEVHTDRYGRTLFLSFTVPQAELAATQGLVGQFYSSYPPSQAPEAVETASQLDLDMTSVPLSGPYFALWEGTLLAPQYGEYTFDLLAEGDAAALQIGREHRLDLAEGGAGSLTATLTEGFHPLRLEYRVDDTAGRLHLAWSGPGFGARTVGAGDLYTFSLGSQGLVGYYYPNGEWQGAPALVRNDLLITPNNPLREPFSILWRGKIAIPESGAYTFGTRSDDGSFLYIDGQLVVDNGGSHGAEDRQGSLFLAEGFHDIEVRYNELGGSREMQLWWQPPGQGRAVMDSRYLFPLEGAAIPGGLTLPPPPEIVEMQAEERPAPGSAPVEQPMLSGGAPVVRPSGDFPALSAELIWSYGGVCGVAEEQLSTPRGVAISPVTGDVFVAEAGSGRIARLSADGEFLLSFGEAGSGPAQFQEAFDLVVEPTGMVVVLDAAAQQLLRFTPDGEYLTTFGAEQTFYRPRGLGADLAGQLVVADTGGVRIVKLDATGALLGQVGGRDTGLAEKQPTDAVSTPQGDIYFVEAENGAVTRVTADGSVSAWSGPIPASTIDGPHLAWRPAGGVYVTDPEGRRVLLFDTAGQPVGQFGVDFGLAKPVGIAAMQAGAGVDRVVVVDSQGCQVLAVEVAMP
jgi:hypothetical protein